MNTFSAAHDRNQRLQRLGLLRSLSAASLLALASCSSADSEDSANPTSSAGGGGDGGSAGSGGLPGGAGTSGGGSSGSGANAGSGGSSGDTGGSTGSGGSSGNGGGGGSPGPVLAFPGAAGYGKHTKGGRGGKVIEVTTLADSGAGSLRWAIDSSGPRIVVFRVGGTINLSKPLDIKNPFLTIAGQTAPGGGILLKGDTLRIRASEVIVRNLRIRPGAAAGSAVDGIGIAAAGTQLSNVVVDHCSVSWSSDENIGINGVNGGVRDVTISNSLLAECLLPHSMGLLINNQPQHATKPDRITVFGNLMMHQNNRHPAVGYNVSAEVINNTIYNFANIGTRMKDASKTNIIGNFYKAGPSTSNVNRAIDPVDTPLFYVEGNLGPLRTSLSQPENFILKTDDRGKESPTPVAPSSNSVWLSADKARDLALQSAGALPRDAVDKRLVADFKNGTGKTISVETAVGGYPTIAGGTAPTDSDHDGMPDVWETANGFNPNNAADGPLDKDGDGYTNVEEYLNSLL